MGLDIPEAYGGLGLDTLTCAIILEEISAVWFSAGTYPVTLLTGPLLFAGTKEQQNKYLPKVASGELITAFRVDGNGRRLGCGLDPYLCRTRWRRLGDQWSQDLHHQWWARRFDRVVRSDQKDAPRGGGISLFLTNRGYPVSRSARPMRRSRTRPIRSPSWCSTIAGYRTAA